MTRGQRSQRRGCVVLLALVLTACSSAPSNPATGGPPGTRGPAGSGGTVAEPTGPQPTIGPFADPESAAAAVLAATDPGARRAAVLAVLGAVGIGIYASDGSPIIQGAERSENDFWVYDFELDGMLDGLADGDRIPLAELAGGLAGAGVTSSEGPVTEAALGHVLRAGVSAALADPGNRSSLALLVVRALAQREATPVDLGTPSEDPITLDPLANFLVAADVLLPTQAADPSHAATAVVDRASGPVVARAIADADPAALPVRVAAGGCGQIAGSNTVNSWGSGQAAVQLLQGGIRRGMPVSEMLHAILLNGLVAVQTQWDNPHYGHQAAVTTSRLKATYVLRIRPSQTAVACGLFRAVLLGAQGPLVGLPVAWRDAPLQRHGQTVCGATTCAVTKADGASTLLFEPKRERDPVGIGPEIHEAARVTAEADVLTGLGGDLFSRIPNAPIKKVAAFDVDVSYHRSYQVFLDVSSTLRIAPIKPPIGPNIYQNPVMALAHIEGTLEVTAVQDGNGHVGPPLDGTLKNLTRPPAGVPGTCWSATADSHGWKTSQWMVRHAVLYPPQDVAVSLDVAGTNAVDSYWYVICPPGSGRIETKNSGNVVWENQMFLSHAMGPYGMEFAGLGPNQWTFYDDDDVWANGGTLAEWYSPEACNGNCLASSFLRLTLRIVPLPAP